MVGAFFQEEIAEFWGKVKNGTTNKLGDANEWFAKIHTFASNEVFCNSSTSCSIDFYTNPSCPIATNINATGCFPPCKTEGCDYVYRFSNMCPQLFCIHLDLTDYGLIFGLFFFVVGMAISCSCCICYFRCNSCFRRVMGNLCCTFRGRFTRIYDLDVEEGLAQSTSDADRTSLGQRSSSTTDAASVSGNPPSPRSSLKETSATSGTPIYKRGKAILDPVPEVKGEECDEAAEEEGQETNAGIVNERFENIPF